MRLIDADRLKEYIDAQKGRPFIGCTIGEALKIITDEQPTVDAVPVVRCKDCKHWKTAEGVNLSKRLKCCTYHIGHKYVRCDEDFCSRGEQKDRKGNGNEAD